MSGRVTGVGLIVSCFILLGAKKAHVHGAGHLNLAVDKQQVRMQLRVSAEDIVGFEHAPKNDQQRQALATAKEALTTKLGEHIQWPASWKCTWTITEAEFLDEIDDDDDHHHHDKSHDKKAKAKPAKAAKHQHSDIEIDAKAECPGAASDVEVDAAALFKAFPRLKTLNTQFVGADQQTSKTLGRKDSKLTIVSSKK